MIVLRARQQILEILTANAPTASIRRAVGEGVVEYLGFFQQLPGSQYPGWIVKANSPITGIGWNVVIRKDPFTDYRIWVLEDKIPWEHWNPGNSQNVFNRGDNPCAYAEYRKNAKAERRSEVHQEDEKP